MRFIDEAIIKISGGHGGAGCVSFRRETFVPRGGPDGGDGGKGGDVLFVSSVQLSTLQDFRYRRVNQALRGMGGEGANKAGRDGKNTVLKVPVGTIVRDATTLEILFDFTEESQTWIACRGGRGGKGNSHFTSSTFQAPKFAQPGEEGEGREVKLELKLLADVGIIGFPNAGKSSLIARISAAHPKVADYPFTTMVPNLGVVKEGDSEPYVVADVPGLIEGAHSGIGLGDRFLKHVERTKILVHLLELTPLVERQDLGGGIDEILGRYFSLRKELALFNKSLLEKPELIVFNKIDLIDRSQGDRNQDLLELTKKLRTESEVHSRVGVNSVEPLYISTITGENVSNFSRHLGAIVRQLKSPADVGRDASVLPDHSGLRFYRRKTLAKQRKI